MGFFNPNKASTLSTEFALAAARARPRQNIFTPAATTPEGFFLTGLSNPPAEPFGPPPGPPPGPTGGGPQGRRAPRRGPGVNIVSGLNIPTG